MASPLVSSWTLEVKSTITETFYRTHLAQTENHLQDPNNWLTIRAANGLTVPYVGYLELDIEVCGVVVPKRGVLVVKDSDERKGDVCGLLGTNVLCHVPAMSEALRSMTDAEDTPQDVARIVRVAGCAPFSSPHTQPWLSPREDIVDLGLL